MPTVVASGQNAFVSFTDAQGPGQVTTATGQFMGWQPDAEDVGTSDVALGTGQTYKFIYRTDYTATFAINAIPASAMPTALRLKRWLESGGQIVVATQDTQGNTYTCIIAPKGRVTFAYDSTMREYTMKLAVLNLAGAPMPCIYTSTAATGDTITVSPNVLVLTAGQNPIPLIATVRDPNGNPLSLAVTWASTQSSTASVTSTGAQTATVTAGLASGTCNIVASIGGVSVNVPVTVTANNNPAAVVVTPSPLAFTATTYTGTPQVGVSGVPSQLLTAVIQNSASQPLLYTPGALVWSCNNSQFKLTDNLDGTCSVQPLAGAQSGVVTCQVTAAPSVTTTVNVTSVAGVLQTTLIPSQASIALTAVGQQTSITVKAIDQYGVVVT